MNFIIYENEEMYIEKYKKIIFKIMADSDLSYQTIEIKKWEETTEQKLDMLEGNKIYLLDIVVAGKNGIDLARKIRREKGDWISPIIIVSSHKEFKIVGYTEKILMLDFITKGECLEKKIEENIKLALEINGCKKSLSFKHRGTSYRIPFEDICYIEKELNSNMSLIVTKEGEYEIRKSIVELEKELCKNTMFFKTHRSCIANINNIDFVDYEKSSISFGNKTIDLLSRANRAGLKQQLEKL